MEIEVVRILMEFSRRQPHFEAISSSPVTPKRRRNYLVSTRWWWWWRRMARPWLLVFLVLLIIFTSQFEWKQQFGSDIEASPGNSQNQKRYNLGQQESVKEKIILSQEKNIQKLNELVQSLREQLIQCRNQNYVVNGTTTTLTEGLNKLNYQDTLDD